MTMWIRCRHHAAAGLGVALLALGTASCTLSKEDAPPLSGPSEMGTSITLSASPEVLQQDGQSQAVITATVRDSTGKPISNVGIHWDATSSSSLNLPVSLSSSTSVTDASGRTSIILTSPPTPPTRPSSPDTITVLASPVSGTATANVPRSVIVQLNPPTGVLPANNAPVAVITTNPSAAVPNQPVTFDASKSTDEGVACLTRCTYSWDFGDGATANGMTVTHAYPSSSSGYTVTLIVRDDRGAVGSTRTSYVVSDSAPVARFTVTPSSPTAGTEAMFDASASSVSSGSVIRMYTWNFGDGTTESTTTPTKGHTYQEPRVYSVTLTVTATNGARDTTASTAQTLTVR